MFNFKNWFSFRKEPERLVKTFKETRTTYKGTSIYFIHLFETVSGKRRAEYICNGAKYDISQKDGWLIQTDFYQLTVYRWLTGRIDPEIPRYDQCPEEDTANMLRGKIP